jgi:hypothetical protein
MMKNLAVVLTTIAFVTVIFTACKDDATTASQGEGIINGVVTDAETGSPLSGVSIQAQSVSAGSQTVVTDVQGQYSFTFELDSSTTVTLSTTKSGYRDTTIVVPLQTGVVLPVNIALNPRSVIVGGGGSGLAQTIAFLGSTPREISVYGVGGQETAILGFEVRDSLGLPIDAAHFVDLAFTAMGGPGGGEYISPTTVRTNAAGRAYTTFNSGIRSGVVQIVASATVGTRVITTSPVRMVINAGFPDQAHFTIGPEKHNFPTLLFAFGLRDQISVLVGDIYSNPVVTNTAVYFRSSAGVVEATVFTNDDGEGTTDLISGNPQPLGSYATPAYGNGYHYVVARTIGQGGIGVQDSTLIMWSGLARIENISPSTFDIPNGGDTVFTFNVWDYLFHPLAAGTRITVTASTPPPPCPDCPVNRVLSSFGFAGSGTVTLEDVIFPGQGATDFSFTLSDGSTDIDDSLGTAVSVSIAVSGPNGSVGATINGRVH